MALVIHATGCNTPKIKIRHPVLFHRMGAYRRVRLMKLILYKFLFHILYLSFGARWEVNMEYKSVT
jgi:hypothetical protein